MQPIVKAYLAGKVTGSDWRERLFDNGWVMGRGRPGRIEIFDVIIEYGGPIRLETQNDPQDHDHCVWSEFGSGLFQAYEGHGMRDNTTVDRCLKQISDCDIVIAYIESLDSYATYLEIGYACALNKPVVLVVSTDTYRAALRLKEPDIFRCNPSDLWFMSYMPGVITAIGYANYAIVDLVEQFFKRVYTPHKYVSGVQPSIMPSDGYVYLIAAEKGVYKIGRSVDPDTRIRTMGVQLPFEIRPIHTIASKDYAWLEKSLHHRFADKKQAGEWYNLTPWDVNWLTSTKRMDPYTEASK